MCDCNVVSMPQLHMNFSLPHQKNSQCCNLQNKMHTTVVKCKKISKPEPRATFVSNRRIAVSSLTILAQYDGRRRS